MRRELFDLLAACLDRQVGTHFIDEADLADLKLKDGVACLGNARYSHILVPSCTVLLAATEQALRHLERQGLTVLLAGRGPEQVQEKNRLRAAAWDAWFPRLAPVKALAATLPRLIEIAGDATDIRCTAWVPPGAVKPVRLLLNLRPEACTLRVAGRRLKLDPGVVYHV